MISYLIGLQDGTTRYSLGCTSAVGYGLYLFSKKGERKPCHHKKGSLKITSDRFKSLSQVIKDASAFLGFDVIAHDYSVKIYVVKLVVTLIMCRS